MHTNESPPAKIAQSKADAARRILTGAVLDIEDQAWPEAAEALAKAGGKLHAAQIELARVMLAEDDAEPVMIATTFGWSDRELRKFTK